MEPQVSRGLVESVPSFSAVSAREIDRVVAVFLRLLATGCESKDNPITERRNCLGCFRLAAFHRRAIAFLCCPPWLCARITNETEPGGNSVT